MKTLAACAVAAVILAMPARVGANETLAAARDLYASAAYADALTMLNDLLAVNLSREERQTIELYRTLCLVALGRRTEADRSVEAMIVQDPLYRPSADDIPPRLRAAFSDARKRLLPSIIQQKYSEAKAAFDRQEFALAAAGFKQVLAGLADPDIATVASQTPLSDLRTLADGFHVLSATAAAPPPQPAAAPEPVAAVVPQAPPKLYTGSDPNVVPPLVVRQQIPPFPGIVKKPAVGVIEVVINDTGTVELARMSMPMSPQYDRLVLSAAKAWQYEPAKVDGVPVKYRKLVQISLVPTP